MRRPAAVLGLALAAGLLGACYAQTIYLTEAQLVGPPLWSPGDRWMFRRLTSGVAGVVVTHEVVEVTADGYLMRIMRQNQELMRFWTRDLRVSHHAVQGQPLNRFEPPALYFAWPLAKGKMWTQEFFYRDGKNDGRYTNTWRVSMQDEMVDVTAGWFPAIRVERLGADGQRLEAYWYAPAIRYWARHEDNTNGFVDILLEFRSAMPPT